MSLDGVTPHSSRHPPTAGVWRARWRGWGAQRKSLGSSVQEVGLAAKLVGRLLGQRCFTFIDAWAGLCLCALGTLYPRPPSDPDVPGSGGPHRQQPAKVPKLASAPGTAQGSGEQHPLALTWVAHGRVLTAPRLQRGPTKPLQDLT